MSNTNPLPTQIKLSSKVVASWDIIDGAIYELDMSVNDKGDEGTAPSKMGLFYSTDKDQGAPVNYAGFMEPLVTQEFKAKLHGSKLHGFSFLPLNNTVYGGVPSIDIGPNDGEGKVLAGLIHYRWDDYSDSKLPVVSDSDLVEVYTKGIEQLQTKYEYPQRYVYATFGVLPGVTLTIFSLQENLYLHIVDSDDNLYIIDSSHIGQNFFFPYKDKNKRPTFMFAAIATNASDTESTDERHFEIGDPRIDGRMKCRGPLDM